MESSSQKYRLHRTLASVESSDLHKVSRSMRSVYVRLFDKNEVTKSSQCCRLKWNDSYEWCKAPIDSFTLVLTRDALMLTPASGIGTSSRVEYCPHTIHNLLARTTTLKPVVYGCIRQFRGMCVPVMSRDAVMPHGWWNEVY